MIFHPLPVRQGAFQEPKHEGCLLIITTCSTGVTTAINSRNVLHIFLNVSSKGKHVLLRALLSPALPVWVQFEYFVQSQVCPAHLRSTCEGNACSLSSVFSENRTLQTLLIVQQRKNCEHLLRCCGSVSTKRL